MITETDLQHCLQEAFPDGDIALMDLTGMQDHYRLFISSHQFKDKPLIAQHQLVYSALNPLLKSGQLHAVEIKTDTPD